MNVINATLMVIVRLWNIMARIWMLDLSDVMNPLISLAFVGIK